MSDDRIFIRFKGKTLGPLTSTKVQELVRRGQITRMHELSSDALSWTRAEEFGDFFRPTRSATASPQGGAANATRTTDSASYDQLEMAPVSRPRPGEAAVDNVEWFAHIGGANRGPMTTIAMNAKIQSSEIERDTLVWRSGFDEWMPAADAFADQFAPAQSDSLSAASFGSSMTGRSDSELIERMVRPRGWVMFLSISLMVLSAISTIYVITQMVVGTETRFAGRGSGVIVLAGLMSLTFNGLTAFGAVLLLKYARGLGELRLRPDMNHAAESMTQLDFFWKYTAIVVIVIQVLLVGGGILLLTIGAATVTATK